MFAKACCHAVCPHRLAHSLTRCQAGAERTFAYVSASSIFETLLQALWRRDRRREFNGFGPQYRPAVLLAHPLGWPAPSAIVESHPGPQSEPGKRAGATAAPRRGMSVAQHLPLAELDARIAETERLLTLCRECEFATITAAIERDINAEILPKLLLLLTMTDGADRRAVAERLKRVRRMLQ